MSHTPHTNPEETPHEGTRHTPHETPETSVEESDPNADSRDGLAGGMGVSSEWRGPVRGAPGEVTYAAAAPPVDDDPESDPESDPGQVPPEQSATDGRPEVNPPSPGRHESDPDHNPGHGI